MLDYFRQLLKKRYVKLGLEILFFIALFMAVRAWQQRDVLSGTVPDVSAVTINGQTVSILSDKKPLLIHFWATWCPVCRLEQGSIDALAKDYNVVTIAMQSGENDLLETYLQENQLSFPVINDSDGTLVQRFGVRGVPASFVVDSENKIAFTEVGYTSEIGLRLRMWLAK